jgi:hypothetical protein
MSKNLELRSATGSLIPSGVGVSCSIIAPTYRWPPLRMKQAEPLTSLSA